MSGCRDAMEGPTPPICRPESMRRTMVGGRRVFWWRRLQPIYIQFERCSFIAVIATITCFPGRLDRPHRRWDLKKGLALQQRCPSWAHGLSDGDARAPGGRGCSLVTHALLQGQCLFLCSGLGDPTSMEEVGGHEHGFLAQDMRLNGGLRSTCP